MKSRSRAARRRAAAIAIACIGIAFACGCAYFNTFYNAKSNFKKAERERVESLTAGGRGGDASYEKCIEKCQTLLRYYPKSKYVDDALYLIGLSRLHRGEYVQAGASLEELIQRFPDSEYVEKARYYVGIAALEQGDAAGASAAFKQLETDYPDSDLNVEAIFRAAESKLEARDYETARTELRQFLVDHPKSKLAGQAQLELARTYYEEERYVEAQTEYVKTLSHDLEPAVRYEAQLNAALSQRALAEEVLANPVLARASRLRKASGDLARFEEEILARETEAARNQGSPQRQQQPPPGQQPGQPPFPGQAPGEFTPTVNGVPARPEDLPLGDPRREAWERARAGAGEQPGDETQLTPEERDRAQQIADRAEQENQTPAGTEPTPSLPTETAENPVQAATDSLAARPMSATDEQALQGAERSLDDVSMQLVSLRKPAGRLDRQVDLDIEIAVTRALCGQPGDAIAGLDQIARGKPRTDVSARARYEIGEIYRRLGEFEKSRRAYDDALKEKPDAPVATSAQRKSTAIVARTQAIEALREAPDVLQRWDAVRDAPLPNISASDSLSAQGLGERIQLETRFEELARQQLRVGEIDLFELDQPLVALREFQEVLDRYDGSLQEARAAFGVAWIYHQKLNDPERARQAYEVVARNHADSPQGREARTILDHWAENPKPEVPEPSRP